MYQDFENLPRHLYSESYVDPLIWEWMELEEDERHIVGLYWNENDTSASIVDILGRYRGVISSEASWSSDEKALAEFLIDEQGLYDLDEIPEWARGHFDYESYGREMLHSYTIIKDSNYDRHVWSD